jgi:hypothetical protein
MVGREAAALCLMTAARHASARFMLVLHWLDLPVQHASVCIVGGMTVQDAVVDVPAAALRDECALRGSGQHCYTGCSRPASILDSCLGRRVCADLIHSDPSPNQALLLVYQFVAGLT